MKNQPLSKQEKQIWMKRDRRMSKSVVNFYSRVKKDNKTKLYIKQNQVICYLDTETFQVYKDKENDKELPIIQPYLIGVYINGNYKYYIGEEGLNNFIKEFFSNSFWNTDSKHQKTLAIYNVDYDFQALRPFITDLLGNQITIEYTMAEEKKFLFGEFFPSVTDHKGKLFNGSIRLLDLAKWNPISLKGYLEHINSIVYNKDGSYKQNDKVSEALRINLEEHGFNRSNPLVKLDDTFVYTKVNLHKKGNDYYYWLTKEDWIAQKEPEKLDLETELKYLENDVKSLACVYKEQELFRQTIFDALGIKRTIDTFKGLSIPSFAKFVCEELEEKYMTETYRAGVPEGEYKEMQKSYTGAFTAGNAEITYIDEEIFKKMYPNKSFFDKEGNPIIRSYDVNSMYPWAMSLGLPCGVFQYSKPKGKYVEWYEVDFVDYWDTNVSQKQRDKGMKGRWYAWKPQYAYLNNSFFGDNFEHPINKNFKEGRIRVFILKELWELFKSMCHSKAEVIGIRYQPVSTEICSLVNRLYEIKQNKEGKYSESTVKAVKLFLNSLYGKMAEQFKSVNITWCSNAMEFLFTKEKYRFTLQQLSINKPIDIDIQKLNKAMFKREVAPFINLSDDQGFFICDNEDKRTNDYGEETRESILAGAFITAKSRWLLLSSIKGEIDQGNVVLYCDTDSIKLLQFKKPKFRIHKDELGAWKDEGSYTHFGHTNKLKKYFMYSNIPGVKKPWMVKTSGIHESFIKNEQGQYDLEMIKDIYNPNNNVLVKESKKQNCRNDLYQTVIKKRSDFWFTMDEDFIPKYSEATHIIDKNKLICLKK